MMIEFYEDGKLGNESILISSQVGDEIFQTAEIFAEVGQLIGREGGGEI
jgi:hypothetical protein